MTVDMNLLNGLTELIGNVGFPIFISVFLLNRMETKLDHMIEALNQLTEVIAKEKR